MPSELHQQQVLDLAVRTHHYLLLQLARHRCEDAARGLDSKSQGWVYAEQLAAELGLADTTRLLVFAGRGSREKNLPVLLDCMRRLGKHYHLLLVGSHMPTHVPANVTIINHFCPATQVARLLASADALLHAGDQETFGLVILEAMASATPVVAVRAGAFGEIVNEQCGRLCQANDGPAMAQAAGCEGVTIRGVSESTPPTRFAAEVLAPAFEAAVNRENFGITLADQILGGGLATDAVITADQHRRLFVYFMTEGAEVGIGQMAGAGNMAGIEAQFIADIDDGHRRLLQQGGGVT